VTGAPISTTRELRAFRDWLLEQCRARPDVRFVNATQAGLLHGAGIEQAALDDVMAGRKVTDRDLRATTARVWQRSRTPRCAASLASMVLSLPSTADLWTSWLSFAPAVERDAIVRALEAGARPLTPAPAAPAGQSDIRHPLVFAPERAAILGAISRGDALPEWAKPRCVTTDGRGWEWALDRAFEQAKALMIAGGGPAARTWAVVEHAEDLLAFAACSRGAGQGAAGRYRWTLSMCVRDEHAPESSDSSRAADATDGRSVALKMAALLAWMAPESRTRTTAIELLAFAAECAGRPVTDHGTGRSLCLTVEGLPPAVSSRLSVAIRVPADRPAPYDVLPRPADARPNALWQVGSDWQENGGEPHGRGDAEARRRGRKVVLGVIIDAFRPDYLRYTRHLRRLAETSRVGRLRESFGFCPHAAYFGGLAPSETGFTNRYWLDPDRSPFSAARCLAGPATATDASLEGAARSYIADDGRRRTTPFASTYLDTAAIPLDVLHRFDVAEQLPPWDPNVGYRSIFHALDDRRLPWFACIWPDFDSTARGGDEAVLQRALARLTPEHAFAFVHFSSLDGVGHQVGPGSRACRDAVQELDERFGRLLAHCGQMYDEVDLVVFGDHGMVTVVKNVDVRPALLETGLVPGIDFHHFVDSTMIRFWFASRGACRTMEAALRGLPGTIVDDRMKRDLEIHGCDPRNGELFFLAHPGVQFFPNFFQSGGTPPKATHGYHPDCPDDQGFFMVRRAAQPGPSTVGVVRAEEVFHTCCDLLSLPNISWRSESSAFHRSRTTADAAPFSLCAADGVDAVVNRDLRLIVDAVRAEVPDAAAVVLTGGFGRGEGSVSALTPEPTPLNDYDVLVACRQEHLPRLEVLGPELATRLGIDSIDLSALDPEWFDRVYPSLFTYDLRYGSRTIWGRADLVESVPTFAPEDVSLSEALQLLLSRVAGLLGVFEPRYLDPGALGHAPASFVRRMTKAVIAAGDARLIRIRDYATSYRERQRRLLSLRHALGLADDEARLVSLSYEHKLFPDEAPIPDLSLYFSRLQPFLERTLIDATACLLEEDPASGTISTAMASWESRAPTDHRSEMRILRSAMAHLWFAVRPDLSLDDTLVSAAVDRCRHLEPGWSPTAPDRGVEAYGLAREVLVRRWEARCH
jgi:hypothetical protein